MRKSTARRLAIGLGPNSIIERSLSRLDLLGTQPRYLGQHVPEMAMASKASGWLV